MSEFGWGYGGPAEANSETGLAEVLSAYVAYGGQLAGSRRWADNPLALTHVRWIGPSGQILSAVRRPGDESMMLAEVREAWVQLALHYPNAVAPVASGPNAPWMTLSLQRGDAQQLSARISRSQPPDWFRSRPSRGEPASGPRPPMPPVSSRPPYDPAPINWPPTPRPPHPPHSQPGARVTPMPPLSPVPPLPSMPRLPSMPPDASMPGAPRGEITADEGTHEPSDRLAFSSPLTSSPGHQSDPWGPTQTSGSSPIGYAGAPEVMVVPCVEIELPPTMGGMATADYARDYARDVALHFARAAHTIPQVRELRAWTRGDRLVLGARMVLGTGTRAPTRGEMEGAARLLGDALAHRTLPYALLSFADPLEWETGSPLPV